MDGLGSPDVFKKDEESLDSMDLSASHDPSAGESRPSWWIGRRSSSGRGLGVSPRCRRGPFHLMGRQTCLDISLSILGMVFFPTCFLNIYITLLCMVLGYTVYPYVFCLYLFK